LNYFQNCSMIGEYLDLDGRNLQNTAGIETLESQDVQTLSK